MKTKLAALLLASVALSGCDTMLSTVATVECNGEQSACLDAWFAEKWEEELAFSPLRQTALGLKTNYDKIDDYSAEGQLEQIEWWEKARIEMEANFDYDELNEEAKISYDMFKYRAERAALSRDFMDHQYILEQMDGAHTGLPSIILSQHTVENEAEMEAFISRLAGIGTAMDQTLARAQANAEKGVRPPRFAYDFVIEESKYLCLHAQDWQ